jgi:hypothetical protein
LPGNNVRHDWAAIIDGHRSVIVDLQRHCALLRPELSQAR